MRMLVTGGCGFIGSNFIRKVVKLPDVEVVNLDKLTYAGNRSSLEGIEGMKNYSLVVGDVCNKDDVSNAMDGVDAIVHFAAASHVDRSIEDASDFIHTNVYGTYNILNEARKRDIQKMVFISTDEVYGQIESGKFKETDVLNPRNPYSASKAAADRLAYSFFATYGLPVVITRSSNNYGPYQFPEKMIPRFITNLLAGRKVPLYGDGKNVRDWIHVEDNCDAILHCMERGKPGETYNIGGGNEVTNLELTRMILKNTGHGESMIKFVQDRPGHDRRYSLDTSKVEGIGWSPSKGFELGIRDVVEWYKMNERWWGPLVK